MSPSLPPPRLQLPAGTGARAEHAQSGAVRRRGRRHLGRVPAGTMAEGRDRDVYTAPPPRTPVADRTTSVPNPVTFLQAVFSYVIDTPVTFVRGTAGPGREREWG